MLLIMSNKRPKLIRASGIHSSESFCRNVFMQHLLILLPHILSTLNMPGAIVFICSFDNSDTHSCKRHVDFFCFFFLFSGLMTNFFNKTSKENLKKYMSSANFQASSIVVISPCTTWINLPWTRNTRRDVN